MMTYMKIGWRPLQVHNISNIICNNNNRHKKVYMLLGLQMERVETQPSFAIFGPLEIHVPNNRLGFTKGFPFEFELGSRLV
jgi:hypothetical protein